MLILGLETRGGGRAPCVFPGSLPLSPYPVTCAVSDEGEEERGPGHGGDGHRVLPSVAPQLKQSFPQMSPFPSSYSERGRVHSCK